MDFDAVIRNGRIIDGTGNSWYKADVGVKDGRIARISPIPLKEAERFLDAAECPLKRRWMNQLLGGKNYYRASR